MEINLLPPTNVNLSIRLDKLIKSDGNLPIDLMIEDEKLKLIRKQSIKVKFSSYPILKDGRYFDVECEITPRGLGYFLSDYLIPMGLELKKIFDDLTPGTYSLHTLDHLWVEQFFYDTESETLGMELGS